jgi:hypothetical protein
MDESSSIQKSRADDHPGSVSVSQKQTTSISARASNVGPYGNIRPADTHDNIALSSLFNGLQNDRVQEDASRWSNCFFTNNSAAVYIFSCLVNAIAVWDVRHFDLKAGEESRVDSQVCVRKSPANGLPRLRTVPSSCAIDTTTFMTEAHSSAREVSTSPAILAVIGVSP